MTRLLASTALALVLAAPLAYGASHEGAGGPQQTQTAPSGEAGQTGASPGQADGAGQPQPGEQAVSPGQPADQQAQQAQPGQQPGQLQIVSASEFIERPLRTQDGQEAGNIRYILFDMAGGEAAFVVAGSGGQLDLGQELVAIPWEAVTLPEAPEHPVVVNASLDTLRKAPRIDEQGLAELTSPTLITSVREFYGPVQQQGQAPAGQQAQGIQPGESEQLARQGQEPPQDEQRADTQIQPGEIGQAQPGEQKQAEGGIQPGEAEQLERQDQQAGTQPQPEGQPEQQAQARQGGEEAMILIGREVVRTLVPPTLAAAQQLSGAEVNKPDGGKFGEIRQVMLDVEHGRIAYLVIEPEGQQPASVAVPFEPLQWTADAGLVLDVEETRIGQAPEGFPGEQTAEVGQQELESLYQHYGVDPYWQ